MKNSATKGWTRKAAGHSFHAIAAIGFVLSAAVHPLVMAYHTFHHPKAAVMAKQSLTPASINVSK